MKLSRIGHRIVLAALAVLTAGAVTAAGVPTALAGVRSGSAASKWRVVARTPGALDAVIAPTATSAWAFGVISDQRPGGRIKPVARHWNGHRWTAVTMPSAVRESGMACAGAGSATNVWAFFGAGSHQGNPPATAGALRLQHGRWVLSKSFPNSYVTGCDVLGPHNVWVFGGAVAGLGRGVGTWHLTSSGWHLVKTGNLVLFNASVVSAKDIWATAAQVTDHGTKITPIAARWNGHSWVPARSFGGALPQATASRGVALESVNALSARDVWVKAIIFGSRGVTRTVVAHWNGQTWRAVGTANPGYYLPGAVRDGRGGWWSQPLVQSASAPFLLHQANGHWTRFRLPVGGGFGLGGIALARVPRSASMLAAGASEKAGAVLALGPLPR